MIGASGVRAAWRARGLSLLMTLALALNLLGPVNGLPAKDGYVPICTGSEIVYIPLSALGLAPPSDDTPAPTSDPCPWFAQFHALAVAPLTDGYGAVVYRLAPFAPADIAAAGQQIPGSFQARAPPHHAA